MTDWKRVDQLQVNINRCIGLFKNPSEGLKKVCKDYVGYCSWIRQNVEQGVDPQFNIGREIALNFALRDLGANKDALDEIREQYIPNDLL